ncbi:MAG: alpha/beta fold hydrolase [Austwickia sp.]|nr:alpha/beta fold hydrolase [Austwickia sp.]MBK8436611.1 alpha/beta fold hydrolase [Austwickia sp.]MBK9102276.1 alpha/beta fold hydrolase [Austwickia sp.]
MERIVTVANGTRLCIDELGDPAGPLTVQLEGHMAQLVATPSSFCQRLADRGVHVVRVDHRDVGRSQRFPGVDYDLQDMAEDTHGLVAELGRPAIVCGRSMGGMIAQLLALTHPGDVAALGLFYTAAGSARAGQSDPEPMAEFPDLDAYTRWQATGLPGIAGPAYPASLTDIAEVSRRSWQRGVDAAGFTRQARALARTPDWRSRLAEIAVPVTIVHGDADPVIPLPAAHELQALIPGSVLTVVPGMGHQQPVELDAFFADVVTDLRAQTAEARDDAVAPRWGGPPLSP